MRIPFTAGSTLFAPMEGVTNGHYRLAIDRLYPHWDAYLSDFLRVPSKGIYPDEYVLRHWGVADAPADLQRRTALQFLISPTSDVGSFARQCQRLQIPWIDVNLGCPSKTVTRKGGGSAWLQNLSELRLRLGNIRQAFDGIFSAKIRTGWDSSAAFLEILRALEECGIDFITVHGRTREQLYKGAADWGLIATAVKHCSIPIIGNGDVWTPQDKEKMLAQTGCHSVMVARGALKSPWFNEPDYLEREQHAPERMKYLETMISSIATDTKKLKHVKNLSRYLWDALEVNNHPHQSYSQTLKSRVLRSQSLSDFYEIIP